MCFLTGFLKKPLLTVFSVSVLLLSDNPFGGRVDAFELFDGDRVVFVGNTFIEREIDYGHIEAALTLRWPDRNVTFRNLGWSGDDARGRARRYFGTVEDGFNHLKTHVHGLDPTVIFVAYGAMESFAGREELQGFIEDMNRVLDVLAETGARIVLISPFPHEKLGPPLPDPTKNNQNLRLYSETLRTLASERRHHFVNLFDYLDVEMKKSAARFTDNGIHLNEYGYQLAAQGILADLGSSPVKKSLVVSARGHVLGFSGIRPNRVQAIGNGVRITLAEESISDATPVNVSVRDLFAGNYTLSLYGRNLGTHSSQEWAQGVDIPWTPTIDQVRQLLETIKKKNEFYFHKWRPQNETYLRGFRSHEQGQNASELEEFDEYIEKEESRIRGIVRPRVYSLELIRNPER